MKQTSGLTLIEVLVALSLFAIVFVVLANLQITSLKVTRDSKQASIATQTANDAMEDVVAEIFRTILVDGDMVHAITEYSECGYTNTGDMCTPRGSVNGYTYEAVISGLLDPTLAHPEPEEFINEGLVKISVTVDGYSQATFTSYVSCYDVSDTLTLEEGQPCPNPYDPDTKQLGAGQP